MNLPKAVLSVLKKGSRTPPLVLQYVKDKRPGYLAVEAKTQGNFFPFT